MWTNNTTKGNDNSAVTDSDTRPLARLFSVSAAPVAAAVSVDVEEEDPAVPDVDVEEEDPAVPDALVDAELAVAATRVVVDGVFVVIEPAALTLLGSHSSIQLWEDPIPRASSGRR